MLGRRSADPLYSPTAHAGPIRRTSDQAVLGGCTPVRTKPCCPQRKEGMKEKPTNARNFGFNRDTLVRGG